MSKFPKFQNYMDAQNPNVVRSLEILREVGRRHGWEWVTDASDEELIEAQREALRRLGLKINEPVRH